MIRPALAGLLTVLIALGIANGTLTPPGDSPPPPIPDKFLHLTAFAALVLPLSWVRFRTVVWLVPAALAFGAAIELVQPAMGRSAEWADLAADAAGIAIGLVPGWLRHRRRCRP